MPREPVTVRLDPASMGDLYRAMVKLDDRARDDPRPLWVHVPDRRLHEVVHRFGVRGLSVHDLSRRRRLDDDVHGRHARSTSRPEGAE